MDPWSKGDYSRHIREASMAMEGLPEVVPPSGRVPRQLLLAALILKRRRQWYKEDFGNNKSILGVSSTGAKYRPTGAPRGTHQAPKRAGGAALGGAPSWVPGGSTPFLLWCFGKL